MGSFLLPHPIRHDQFLDSERNPSRAPVRTTRPIHQTGFAFLTSSSEPPIRRLAGYPRCFSSLRHRPSVLLDPIHQQPSAKRCQPGLSVTHEGLLEIRGHHTHESKRQALTQSSINNVPGKDT